MSEERARIERSAFSSLFSSLQSKVQKLPKVLNKGKCPKSYRDSKYYLRYIPKLRTFGSSGVSSVKGSNEATSKQIDPTFRSVAPAHDLRTLWSQKPFGVWFLGPESLNIGYLDPLGQEVGIKIKSLFGEQGSIKILILSSVVLDNGALESLTLRLQIGQNPYTIWSLGPKA